MVVESWLVKKEMLDPTGSFSSPPVCVCVYTVCVCVYDSLTSLCVCVCVCDFPPSVCVCIVIDFVTTAPLFFESLTPTYASQQITECSAAIKTLL